MFFTRIGKVLAHLIFWFSVLQFAIAFGIGFGSGSVENDRFYANRYLSAATSGEATDRAVMYILIAVALGVLCEISSKRSKPDNQA